MIPDDVITQIRDAADIVQVIGQHVQLRRAGRNWKGLCPFHGEKTPSFNVSPDKGFFHCFGCQKHGDVFTFVMELEGKSFIEAAEQLGARFGIAIPRVEENPELRRARGERVAMLEMNKLATQFFREMLADEKRGEPGRAYLAKRGVTQETADKFQLGYAPSEWGLLADYLKTKRADLELAVKLGLVAHRPRAGGYYDRNRDRLVCPVIVPGGDVVGFSARVVGVSPPSPPMAVSQDNYSEPPKYINSPESAVYKKSKLLFGLAQAREAMAVTKRAVLVEGNFDVITLHQAGFGDVIAPLGTALTAEQIGVLKRLVERIVLLYDGDRAGYKATMHALQMCMEQEVEVLIASSPGHAKSGGLSGALANGMDPDSLIAGGGTDLLHDALKAAKGAVEFFVFEVWSKAKQNVDARARVFEDASRLIAKVTNPMRRDLIVDLLAKGLEVDNAVVRAGLARASGGGPGRPGGGPPSGGFGANRHPNAPDPDAQRQAATGSVPVALPPAEEVEVISLLADHPSLIATVEADKAFWLLTDARLQAMYSAARAGQSLHELATSGQLPPPTTVQLLSGKYADSKDPRAALVGMTRHLEARKSKVGLAELNKQMAQAYRHGDHESARRIAQLIQAERKGDHELAAQLRASLETSNGKQVD